MRNPFYILIIIFIIFTTFNLGKLQQFNTDKTIIKEALNASSIGDIVDGNFEADCLTGDSYIILKKHFGDMSF